MLNSFSSSLAGKNILLLTDGDPRARELYQLLRENGAETCLVAIPETPPAGLKFEIEFASELAAALAGEEGAVAGLEAYDDLDILGRLTGCPDSIILTPSPGPAALPGQLFLGLLEEELLASGNRGGSAFPGGGRGGIGAKGTRVAEDVDTFWGKFTLLGILSEDGGVDPGNGRHQDGGSGTIPAYNESCSIGDTVRALKIFLGYRYLVAMTALKIIPRQCRGPGGCPSTAGKAAVCRGWQMVTAPLVALADADLGCSAQRSEIGGAGSGTEADRRRYFLGAAGAGAW